MWNNVHPNQISLFDPLENGDIVRNKKCERLGHIYHHIISIENLLWSWQEFLCGKKKRKDVAEFSVNLLDNIFTLHKELVNKTYKHKDYQAFKVNDPKPRDIHKAQVRDRLIHHAVYRILYPYFDRKFIFDSYSCRNKKGTHKAIERFRKFSQIVSRNNTRTCWILKCDIQKFFANIDHKILKKILIKHIADKDVLWLLTQIIDSFETKGKTEIGLPLGNLTSQLLVNIYMNELDHFIKRKLKMKYYIRYADDFVIFSENKNDLKSVLPQISKFLKNYLGLLLHPDKVFIKTLFSGVDFLGWVHFTNYRVLRTTTKRRIFKKLRKNHPIESIMSYTGLLSHGNTQKLYKKILLFAKKW